MENSYVKPVLPPGEFTLKEFPKIKVVKDFFQRECFTWFLIKGELYLVNAGFLIQLVHNQNLGLELGVLRFNDKTWTGPFPVRNVFPEVQNSLTRAFESLLGWFGPDGGDFPSDLPGRPTPRPLDADETLYWKQFLKKQGYRDLLDPKPEKANPWQKLVDNWLRRT